MNVKDYKSGVYKKQYGYSSFLPNKINLEWTWENPKINILLEDANKKLGELNAYSLYVPDIDMFISMHKVKEATTSNKIEGTKTEITDAILSEDEVSPEKRNDWIEVQNYIIAMNNSINRLQKLPLSNRLIKQAHIQLMKGARGTHKSPGEFRKSQNWIGGATLKDAVYIPPNHENVNDLMSDLEKFLNNRDINVPHLIRIAIAHYQFETIHPFLDGNGRLGRLLITLYLVNEKVLDKPILYLSEFFERNRTLYYDNLNFTRISNNLEQWIKFFLVGIIETSEKGILTFKKILNLKENIDSIKLVTMGKRIPKARILMKKLYSKPVISSKDVTNLLGISLKPSLELINQFMKLGILKEITGYKRNRLFAFEDYLKLFS